jgi:hypothetical protein
MNGLRFFTHNDPDAVRFELAGGLGGEDVETLHEAWRREAFIDALTPVIVDITFISEVDQYGRALLVVMHRLGAQIIAKSPESYLIAQAIMAGTIEPAITKPNWFRRLTTFLSGDRRPHAEFSDGAKVATLSLTRRIANVEYFGFTQPKEA